MTLTCKSFDPGTTLTSEGSKFCRRTVAGERCGWTERHHQAEVLQSEPDDEQD